MISEHNLSSTYLSLSVINGMMKYLQSIEILSSNLLEKNNNPFICWWFIIMLNS